MRVSAQTQTKVVAAVSETKLETVVDVSKANIAENSLKQIMRSEQKESEKDGFPKENVQKAVDALNEFMTLQNHNSKFVMHEGLERYFVQVVNSETDEVIREIPPRKLLDAFYTMQKFVGMIVDEKI